MNLLSTTSTSAAPPNTASLPTPATNNSPPCPVHPRDPLPLSNLGKESFERRETQNYRSGHRQLHPPTKTAPTTRAALCNAEGRPLFYGRSETHPMPTPARQHPHPNQSPTLRAKSARNRVHLPHIHQPIFASQHLRPTPKPIMIPLSTTPPSSVQNPTRLLPSLTTSTSTLPK